MPPGYGFLKMVSALPSSGVCCSIREPEWEESCCALAFIGKAVLPSSGFSHADNGVAGNGVNGQLRLSARPPFDAHARPSPHLYANAYRGEGHPIAGAHRHSHPLAPHAYSYRHAHPSHADATAH
jgi:hypothetical protein